MRRRSAETISGTLLAPFSTVAAQNLPVVCALGSALTSRFTPLCGDSRCGGRGTDVALSEKCAELWFGTYPHEDRRGYIGMKTAKNECEMTETLEHARDDFRRAGNHLILALDEWIEWRAENLQRVRGDIKARWGSSPKTYATDPELIASRERLRTTGEFLHRLFPDEFADTSSAAE